MSFGYVYVLTNDSLPYVKVGHTTRAPESRAKELSTTGVPTPFKVAYKVYVENCERFERDVHRQLHQYRVRNNREFFEADLTTVVEVIEELRAPQIDEDEDSHFDPLLYVQHLAEDRVIEEEVKALRRDAHIAEAQTYMQVLYENLLPVNGRFNASGNAIYYYLDESDDEIIIYDRVRIYGEPDDVFILGERDDDGYLPFAYDKRKGSQIAKTGQNESPRKLAKYILGLEDWASEEESRQRINSPISLKDMLQAVWDEAVDHMNYMLYLRPDKVRVEIEFKHYYEYDEGHIQFHDYGIDGRENLFKEYFEELYWLMHAESVAKRLHDAGMIPRIVSNSFASISWQNAEDFDRLSKHDSTRNYLLSINNVVPDELEEVEVTITYTEGSEYSVAKTKYGMRLFMKGDDYSEYEGKKVMLDARGSDLMFRLCEDPAG